MLGIITPGKMRSMLVIITPGFSISFWKSRGRQCNVLNVVVLKYGFCLRRWYIFIFTRPYNAQCDNGTESHLPYHQKHYQGVRIGRNYKTSNMYIWPCPSKTHFPSNLAPLFITFSATYKPLCFSSSSAANSFDVVNETIFMTEQQFHNNMKTCFEYLSTIRMISQKYTSTACLLQTLVQ